MSTLATDNFNRADSGTLGSNWTVVGTNLTLKIASNKAVPSVTNSFDNENYYNAITWPDDQYSQVKVFTTSTLNDGSGGGPMCRVSSSAITLYRVNVSLNTATLFRFNAGAFTTLWTRSITLTSGDTVRLETTGSATVTLRVYINGVQVGTDTTDSSANRITSGSAGISYSSLDASCTMDDWEGGDFSGGTVTPGQLVLDNTPIFQLRKVVAY